MKQLSEIKKALLRAFEKDQIERSKLNYLHGGDGDGDGDRPGDIPWPDR